MTTDTEVDMKAAGFEWDPSHQGYPRWTHTKTGITALRQPYMTDQQWEAHKRVKVAEAKGDMTDDSANKPCFIGRCKCGGIMFASVDEPQRRKENAKEVAKLVRGGFSISTETVGVARTGAWCTNSKEHMRE